MSNSSSHRGLEIVARRESREDLERQLIETLVKAAAADEILIAAKLESHLCMERAEGLKKRIAELEGRRQ